MYGREGVKENFAQFQFLGESLVRQTEGRLFDRDLFRELFFYGKPQHVQAKKGFFFSFF